MRRGLPPHPVFIVPSQRFQNIREGRGETPTRKNRYRLHLLHKRTAALTQELTESTREGGRGGKNQEQQHPQERLDRPIVDQLLQSEPNDLNLAECARLRIRYQNFPGAREIQRDLDLILEKWQLDEASLWAKTRPLHSHGQVYQIRQTEEQQDWS